MFTWVLSEFISILTKNICIDWVWYGKSPNFSIEYGINMKMYIFVPSPSPYPPYLCPRLSNLIYIYIYITTHFLIFIPSNLWFTMKFIRISNIFFHLIITFRQLCSDDVCQLNTFYVLHFEYLYSFLTFLFIVYFLHMRMFNIFNLSV